MVFGTAGVGELDQYACSKAQNALCLETVAAAHLQIKRLWDGLWVFEGRGTRYPHLSHLQSLFFGRWAEAARASPCHMDSAVHNTRVGCVVV